MVISRPVLWPAALAGLLALVALAELLVPADSAPAIPAPRATAAAAASPTVASGLAEAWSATILARPIFRPDRRPMSAAPEAPAEMPKLSAIVITGAGASAIFVDSSGAVMALRPGGLVDGQVIKSITSGAVTLAGPTGTTTALRPQFGADQGAPQGAPQTGPQAASQAAPQAGPQGGAPIVAPGFTSGFGAELPPPGTPAIPPESPVNAGINRDVPLAGIPNNVDRP